MIYPTLNSENSSRDFINTFGGYNHNLRIAENEFYDMTNMTSDHYPLLCPRGKRGVYAETESPNGLIAKDALCYVDGNTLYINKEPVLELDPPVLELDPPDLSRQLVSMGAYIVIFPDKMYVNTQNYADFGKLEASFELPKTVSATYEMCDIDGNVYDIIDGNDPPADTTKCWVDASSTPYMLKQYSTSSGVWSQISTTYIKITAHGIALSFNQYDSVKISGLPTDIEGLKDIEGTVCPLYSVYHDPGEEEADHPEGRDDYVVIVGFLRNAIPRETALRLERNVPDMDFVIESGNRLWGCKYGIVDGRPVNEIYASKLGDFKNWNCFMGLSTDSYAASCGTDGQWTGAITHLGYPLFFKENVLHKVYGNFPSNFQIQSTACRGVQKGAGNSLAIVNEALFYKGRNGICVYDGSLPTEISSAFGDIHYSAVDESFGDPYRNGAVGGAHNNKYYISMRSEKDGKWYLFVFDTASGLWHKEDNTRAAAFCSCDNEMYYIDHDDKKIKTVFGSGTLDASSVKWMAETGVIGTDSPDKKYVSKLNVRMALDKGAEVAFYAQYDSFGQWHHVSSMVGSSLRTFTTPIRPRRCDHFRLRIVGRGEAKIYSISKTTEEGSDAE